MPLTGQAHKFGDNIDTDVIIPSVYCVSFEEEALGPHCMEGTMDGFMETVTPGDFIVAGENFGSGSSRENAPIAIKGAGIAGVVAASFARIFFRNAINLGLPIFESPEAAARIAHGDALEIAPRQGTIRNLTRNEEYTFTPYPEDLTAVVKAGGMVPYVRQRLAERKG